MTPTALRLVGGLRDLEPGTEQLGRDDVEEFAAFTDLLGQHADDSKVMAAFFIALGAGGALQVPILVQRLAARYDAEAVGRADSDNWWDADTRMSARVSALEQQLVKSLGAGLGLATRSGALSGDFGTDLAATAAGSSTGEGWGLGQILRYGDYDAGFLAATGAELYAQERAHPGLVWYDQLGGAVAQWTLGTDDDGRYHDPFVGLLEAMGRTPDGALAFLNPDHGGPTALERAEYLIQERAGGAADDANALGEALDAAATGFRAPVPEAGAWDTAADTSEREALLARQTDGAWVASAAVHFLAQREPGTGGRRVGEGALDSLGHLLAEYIYDIERTASGNGPAESLGTFDPGDTPVMSWDLGRPVGAAFARDDLNAVLAEVVTLGAARDQVARATSSFDATRMAAAVEAWESDLVGESAVSGLAQSSAMLHGYLIGNLSRGSVLRGQQEDAGYGHFVGLASSVLRVAPVGIDLVSAIRAEIIDDAEERAGGVNAHEESARAAAVVAKWETLEAVELSFAVALAGSSRATHVSYEAFSGDGGRLPWFRFDHSLDTSVLGNPDTLDSFRDWVRADGGDQVTSGLPDLGKSYDDGYDLAEGPSSDAS